jgi:hypothetical protein
MALRFSTVTPEEIAEVARLREIHRGLTPPPVPPGRVPAGPQEQAVAAVVRKAQAHSLPQPLLGVVVGLSKAYVRSHTRMLPGGRTVTIPAYFTKRLPKGDEPTRRRTPKHTPPSTAVHPGFSPEQLAHRLVRHVQDGSLTHEDALANIVHLERRAQRGQGLQHGHGPDWHAGQVHEFVAHARGKLQAHRLEIRRKEEEEIRAAREKNEQAQKELERQKAEQVQAEEERQRQKAEQERQAQEKAARQQRRADMKRKHEERQRQKAEKEQPEQPEQPEQRASGIDYSAIQGPPKVLPKERKFHAQYFDKAPDYIQAAIRKAAPLQALNPKAAPGYRLPRTGSFFIPGAHAITFRPRPVSLYPDGGAPTWRHEFGHHVDYEMGPGRTYGSFSRRAALEDDRTQLLKNDVPPAERASRVAGREQALRAQVDPFETRHADLVAQWARHGFSEDDLEALAPGWLDKGSLSHHAQALDGWEHKDPRTFFTGLPRNLGTLGNMQDLVGAVTRNHIHLEWGHTDKYYGSNRDYNDQHTTEAYANWFATHAHGHPALQKVLAHFLPATNNAFRELTDQWLAGTTT